jgi:hypothetical protein
VLASCESDGAAEKVMQIITDLSTELRNIVASTSTDTIAAIGESATRPTHMRNRGDRKKVNEVVGHSNFFIRGSRRGSESLIHAFASNARRTLKKFCPA